MKNSNGIGNGSLDLNFLLMNVFVRYKNRPAITAIMKVAGFVF